jgi:hypothetical protein
MRLTPWLAAAALCALAGCAAQMVKVEPGQVTVKDALSLNTANAWNRFELGQQYLSVGPGAAEVWTQDGITLDALAFFVGVAQGETLGRAIAGKKLPQFRSTMTPGEIVELYEQMVTQDGSAFALKRVVPGRFGGQPGFRFEHTITRRSDGVLLRGIAQGAVVKDKLYLVAFTAPSIHFYDRHAAQVEPLLASAEITAR